MREPYYQDESVTIFHGDCREIVPELGRFDLLLTDPPYGIDISTHSGSTVEWDSIEGDHDCDLAEWLIGQLSIAFEACIFGANCFPHLLPHRGRWICWDKRLTRAADRMLGSAFELAWTSRVSGFDKMIRVLHGGVVNSNGGKRVHPTEKPIALMAEIIETVYPASQTILDPFAGSGTTGRAAKDLGRKATLIEREEKYCEIAAKRLARGSGGNDIEIGTDKVKDVMKGFGLA